ncbi:MAG: ABC transporter permease, partial [Desulfovibrionales bacterium]|nr:ABC transporter permease [Desulfovibrionales bacterium]
SKITQMVTQGLEAFQSINLGWILISFVIYFLFGYLLYAGMFAAVGAAVDNEADSQQFMLPISLPLILGIILMVNVINNPGSSLAWWGSIIPFTSPVVMMARIPFAPDISSIIGDLILSWTLLIGTFVLMVWISGKIYRTGILMYGKKVTYKELWKWIRYKS